MSRSQVELLRDLRRADRGADLEEQTVRLAELALAGGVVAGQARQLGALKAQVLLKPRALVSLTRGSVRSGAAWSQNYWPPLP
jgi:hypothetical protein